MIQKYLQGIAKDISPMLSRWWAVFDLNNVSHFMAASEVLYLTVYNNKGKCKSKTSRPDVVRMVGQRSTNSMSCDNMMLPYKDRRQHLLTHKVSRYRPLASHGRIIMTIYLLYLTV